MKKLFLSTALVMLMGLMVLGKGQALAATTLWVNDDDPNGGAYVAETVPAAPIQVTLLSQQRSPWW